ncbi:unnamed protein product [Allacma fusca]|uniref:Uncharacterized protein n=1 Tax=Allacma fusca TaxID=39272 RepID=A0A8J2L6R3_9HEXA|nr:unnamed protein product [Allacma fusca]
MIRVVIFLVIGLSAQGQFFPQDGEQLNGKILAGPNRRPYPSGPGNGNQGDQSISDSGNSGNYQHHPSISSVDMQLLAAMEKLVARMDKLDGRVKTLENVVYFLTNKQKPEQGMNSITML